MNRREELDNIFKDVDQNQKSLVNNLIDDVVFLENQMNELKKLPFIRHNPQNSAEQKATVASKQYKDLSQSYDNKIRILLSLLCKIEGSDIDPVSEFLKKVNNE